MGERPSLFRHVHFLACGNAYFWRVGGVVERPCYECGRALVRRPYMHMVQLGMGLRWLTLQRTIVLAGLQTHASRALAEKSTRATTCRVSEQTCRGASDTGGRSRGVMPRYDAAAGKIGIY